jgi:ribosomal protein L3 glutamine methyltransferase
MEEQRTIAQWIEWVAGELDSAGLYFGHGTDNARDEAAWLVLHVVGAPLDGSFMDWGRAVDGPAARRIGELCESRRRTALPFAYLAGNARFAGLDFESGPGALVPRSPIAELVVDGFRPWVDPAGIEQVLDMCTGSGCIAIAVAHYLPQVKVDAADISEEALELAARNVRAHGMQKRVRLLRSDLFQSVPPCRYDLIVANPPYVPAGEIDRLPREYRAEPRLGLASGCDGLDAVLAILVDAPRFLGEDGVLVCEVGESEQRLAGALPGVPFFWLEFEHGGSGVFVLNRCELLEARSELVELMDNRTHVS